MIGDRIGGKKRTSLLGSLLLFLSFYNLGMLGLASGLYDVTEGHSWNVLLENYIFTWEEFFATGMDYDETVA